MAVPSARPSPAVCGSGPLDAAWVHGRAARSVVRVFTQSGSGSGFVIGAGAEQLVVTNHHVLAAAGGHTVEVASDGAAPRRVALEVVKVDREQDLALLRPAAELGVPGLELRRAPAGAGESVVVLGYPSIAGSGMALTLEPGTISAPSRELGGVARVQTNANINPGNSGGPMLDACGRVVGVVSARHTVAERVGLAVPVAALERLLAARTAPRLSPAVEARARLEQFLHAVRYREDSKASAFFGPEFVARHTQPALKQLLSSAERKAKAFVQELRERGQATESLSKEQARELAARLTRDELVALEIDGAVSKGRLARQAAPLLFLRHSVNTEFGDLQQIWIDDVSVDQKGCVDAHVAVNGKSELRRYVVHLHDHWGEWVIDGVRRVR